MGVIPQLWRCALRARFISLKAIVTTGFLALAGFTIVDCGNAVAVCDMKCDCEKCETSAYNACLATGESDRHTAIESGCNDALDDLEACQVATGVCKGPDFATDCGPQKDGWKKCTETKN
ncbi:MAG: hypothetical protein ABI134_24135 [Byssovorax sp.]